MAFLIKCNTTNHCYKQVVMYLALVHFKQIAIFLTTRYAVRHQIPFHSNMARKYSPSVLCSRVCPYAACWSMLCLLCTNYVTLIAQPRTLPCVARKVFYEPDFPTLLRLPCTTSPHNSRWNTSIACTLLTNTHTHTHFGGTTLWCNMYAVWVGKRLARNQFWSTHWKVVK